jgi:hypothetical protein
MIKTIEQAVLVQARRKIAGKKGVAKAVRRFTKGQSRPGQSWKMNYRFLANFEGCRTFDQTHRIAPRGVSPLAPALLQLEGLGE